MCLRDSAGANAVPPHLCLEHIRLLRRGSTYPIALDDDPAGSPFLSVRVLVPLAASPTQSSCSIMFLRVGSFSVTFGAVADYLTRTLGIGARVARVTTIDGQRVLPPEQALEISPNRTLQDLSSSPPDFQVAWELPAALKQHLSMGNSKRRSRHMPIEQPNHKRRR
ncbi:hypothetical protein DIPPA_06878 [Diplonema papillatum]|nr:hypothetical protein DIPPA_06878 [Diplonema papillatum]